MSRGMVCHNGDIIWNRQPVRPGFHARFDAKQGTCYAGPFRTKNEALSVGLDFADFRGAFEVVA